MTTIEMIERKILERAPELLQTACMYINDTQPYMDAYNQAIRVSANRVETEILCKKTTMEETIDFCFDSIYNRVFNKMFAVLKDSMSDEEKRAIRKACEMGGYFVFAGEKLGDYHFQ